MESPSHLHPELFVRRIVAEAATLQERVDWFHQGGDFADGNDRSGRLSRWRDLVGQEGPGAVKQRLAEFGVSEIDLSWIFGKAPVFSGELPEWAALLLTFAEQIKADYKPRAEVLASQFRVHELFRPLTALGISRLKAENGDALSSQLDERAYRSWEIELLDRLRKVGNSTVRIAFTAFQTVAQMQFSQGAAGAASGLKFDDFLGQSPAQRLLDIFAEFPVLARQCAQIVCDWVKAGATFLQRLQVDRTEISRHFADGVDMGRVEDIKGGLSDPHGGGFSVLALKFTSGLKLVYKPRSVTAEAHFSRLMEWADTLPGSYSFVRLDVLDRGQHGWVGYISALGCSKNSEIRRFYWRAGALLGIVHLSRGVDFHRGNLIAAGEHPVLVDLDSLSHPQDTRITSSETASQPDELAGFTSAARTGMLPGGFLAPGIVNDRCAIESNTGAAANPNATLRPLPISTHHLPHLSGEAVRAGDHLGPILAGYRWVGKQLLKSKRTRDHFADWLVGLDAMPRRRIYRSSAVYARILARVSSPMFLRHGIDYRVELNASLGGNSSSDVIKAEIQALERLELPYFRQPLAAGPQGYGPLPSMKDYLREIPLIRQLIGESTGHQGKSVQRIA